VFLKIIASPSIQISEQVGQVETFPKKNESDFYFNLSLMRTVQLGDIDTAFNDYRDNERWHKVDGQPFIKFTLIEPHDKVSSFTLIFKNDALDEYKKILSKIES
jgi:hypothetical protein